jgi:GTPase SAR1 family protein
MNDLIDQKLEEGRITLGKVLGKLIQLTERTGHDQMISTAKELAAQYESPFTFVIVGEVKAGKSSFINALLETDKEICKVAPAPMTDTIQQILYGENERTEIINPYLKKIYQPVEILKEIAIVDTPGTNTIVEHHQEITERFIPYSDLIVFVFEAKNPYRQSSWEFFSFIHDEWRRKIIFVLQQKDLLNDEDLKINLDGVVRYAEQRGIDDPKVFAVSAKDELEGNITTSGFQGLRAYIKSNITGGKAPLLKFRNNLNTVSTINNKLTESLTIRKKQFDLDVSFREDIKDIMNHQESRTAQQISVLTEHLVLAYEHIVTQKERDLSTGLGFFKVLKRSFSAVFGNETGIKEWLINEAKDFELKLHQSLKDKLQIGISDVADSIQNMGRMVDQRIKHSETVLKNSDEIFADIAERRINVLRDLQESFSQFMSNNENFYDRQLLAESSKIAPNLAAGSGIAVVGVILAAAVNGAVFDITGGILTTIGVLFAGVTLGLNKSRIIRQFNHETQIGRHKIESEVNLKLLDYTRKIKSRIDSNFHEFDRMLDAEGKTLTELNALQSSIDDDIQKMRAIVG